MNTPECSLVSRCIAPRVGGPFVAVAILTTAAFATPRAAESARPAHVPSGATVHFAAVADTYPRQPGIDALHYTFRLALDDASDVITGEATIVLRFVRDGVSRFWLDLATVTDGRGMVVAAVTSDAGPVQFTHDADRLHLTLQAPPAAGERRAFTVRYRGVPATGLVIGPNRHGERSFFSWNWPNKARQWLPMIDHPYDKATSEFLVTAPAEYQVVANGLLVEERDLGDGRRLTHWRQSVPIASWLNAIGVAQFAVRHFDTVRGIPLQTWVFHQDRELGIGTFDVPARQSIEFFSEKIGPYPYEKLGNVQAAGGGGGTEHASAIFYGQTRVNGEPATGLVAHEVAHQWWGDAVTERDWDDVWLSEGFATYFTHLFYEHYYGRDTFVERLRRDVARILEAERENPGRSVIHDNLADMGQVLRPGTIIYQKGGWVLHMLRGRIGTETFWQGIREYYRRYRDRNASTDEFRQVMEETSGQDLEWFFQQWTRRPQSPIVRGEWTYDTGSRRIVVVLSQEQPGEPYRLPLDVGITESGSSARRIERIELTAREQRFEFAADAEPKAVVLDPDVWILADMAIGKAEGPARGTGFAQSVSVRVDAGRRIGRMYPMWAWFGHDEPNYTYMEDGRKLLSELAELSSVPVYIRTHNMLTSGDGEAALKWGSTNAYTEDESGNPIYDWTIVDRITDTWLERGIKPLIEIGFMPQALSSRPDPYRHHWRPGDNYGDIYTGWAYPPDDWERWGDLVYEWVRHSVDRYGREEVESWYWEVWNEPDIGYWQGTKEEYFKLYDYAAAGLKRALPTARIGGPHVTSPRGERTQQYLRDFIEHCLSGTNYATGRMGSPLDFVAFHAKGSPRVMPDGHVRMGLNAQLTSIARGFEVVASFPAITGIPIVIGESDPEGCAACPVSSYPHNAYRNGTMFSSYTAEQLARTYEMADLYGVNLLGSLSWAFEFEDQPWFAGFRDLATNGVAKPVLNTFRMLGMMAGDRVAVESTGALPLETVRSDGVREAPDVAALASRAERSVAVLVWNYHDDDLPAPAAEVELIIEAIPAGTPTLSHFRIDHEHSNAYELWKSMGSPGEPTPAQFEQLEAEGRLDALHRPRRADVVDGRVTLRFALPRQGVSLVKLDW